MAKSTIYSFSNAHSVKFIVKLQMNICSKKIKINLPRYRDNCQIFFLFVFTNFRFSHLLYGLN